MSYEFPRKFRRLSEKEKPVTVCIAARCKVDQTRYCIVTVSDMKLSTGIYSGDAATIKLRHLSEQWVCLIAGSFAQHVPLLRRIREEMGDNSSISSGEMAKICTKAYIAENKRLAEESVLAPFGMTVEEFLKRRKELGESIYERTWTDLSRVKLNCQLIVCGFSAVPHIFTVDNPDTERTSFTMDCNFPGFAAIGSGGYLAEATLYSFEQNPTRSLTDTLYTAIAAKFTAESATDVGNETFVEILTPKGEPEVHFGNQSAFISEMRDEWERSGKLRISDDARDVVNRNLRPLDAQKAEVN